MNLMRYAKAIAAFVIVGSPVAVDLSAQFLAAAEDDTIVESEWKLLVLAVITSVGVGLKKNAPAQP
jgi:hypothetical protein